MHVHPSSPQLEVSAATTIQAGFRGYRVRKQMQAKPTKPATAVSAAPSNGKSVMGTSSSSLNIAIIAPTTTSKSSKAIHHHSANKTHTNEDKSATTIQASVRGYLVRKKQKKAVDAATKIQASFRGFIARKELSSKHRMA